MNHAVATKRLDRPYKVETKDYMFMKIRFQLDQVRDSTVFLRRSGNIPHGQGGWSRVGTLPPDRA